MCNKIVATSENLHLFLKSCGAMQSLRCSNICEVLIPQETDGRETGNLVQLYPEKVLAECKRGVRNCRVAPLIKKVGSNFSSCLLPCMSTEQNKT